MGRVLSAKLARYTATGLVTLAVYLMSGAAMQQAGLTIEVLAPIAFTSAVVVNYLLQKAWVFEDSRPVTASLPRYALMVGTGYVLNSVALGTLTPSLPLLWAQMLAVMLVVSSNAAFAFFWVFSFRRGR